jgi:gliding motility-associated-like protein
MGLCCTGVIAVSDTCIQNDITFTVITAENLTSIVWDFGDPASGPNNNSASLSPTHVFSSPGIYTITANANAPCGSFQMSYVVNAVNCASDCSGTLVTNDSCLVNGTSFQISSTNGVNAVFWNFGDPISGNSNTSVLETPTHFFSTAGTYAVQCIVQFSCGADTLYETISVIDCDTLIEQNCELFVPNVFSPNEDGTNDKLFPNMNCPMENYNFQVFNRWGELVFDTSNQFAKWDGKFNGKECLDGVYVYLIHYNFYGQQMKNVCGNVTLVR